MADRNAVPSLSYTFAVDDPKVLNIPSLRSNALTDKAHPVMTRLKAELYPEVLAALDAKMEGMTDG